MIFSFCCKKTGHFPCFFNKIVKMKLYEKRRYASSPLQY
ncbi:hypothetical protein QSI_1847 [Clostridioides difficile P28]|nr:hypothetical protein QSI_1847 [Clostridioides difficile P28]